MTATSSQLFLLLFNRTEDWASALVKMMNRLCLVGGQTSGTVRFGPISTHRFAPQKYYMYSTYCITDACGMASGAIAWDRSLG